MAEYTFKIKSKISIVEAFWRLSEKSFVLTSLSPETITGYYENLSDVIELNLNQPEIFSLYKVSKVGFQDWYIYEINSLNELQDIVLLSQYSEDSIIIFSSDIDSNRLKSWVINSPDQFKPDEIFNENFDFVKYLCSFSLWFGVLSEYGNNMATFVSHQRALVSEFKKLINNN